MKTLRELFVSLLTRNEYKDVWLTESEKEVIAQRALVYLHRHHDWNELIKEGELVLSSFTNYYIPSAVDGFNHIIPNSNIYLRNREGKILNSELFVTKDGVYKYEDSDVSFEIKGRNIEVIKAPKEYLILLFTYYSDDIAYDKKSNFNPIRLINNLDVYPVFDDYLVLLALEIKLRNYLGLEPNSSASDLTKHLYNVSNVMDFETLIWKLKEDGFDIKRQGTSYIWQINNVANLAGITLSQSPVDIHIGLWQDDVENVQTGLKTAQDAYNFITNLTW